MNYKIVSYNIGKLLLVEAVLLAFPALGAIIYGEDTLIAFSVTVAALVICGLLATHKKPEKTSLYAKEGYMIVALSWLMMSAFGALPFVISGYIPNFIDAFFETVSGFTTTGSTILSEIESLPKSLLFWRSFTHWIGGMGILVFAIAIMPKAEKNSMHIMRAEVPGPTVGKLVSKLSASARILYGIYCVLTLVMIIMLWAGGMPLFDSIVNSFATAGTGGFAVLNNSIEGYNSFYAEMVIAVFMIIFGVNFNLYYLIIRKQFKQAVKSEELHWYLGIVAAAVVLIGLNLTFTTHSAGTSFRYSFFQVASIISTTGFSTTDFNKWPVFSKGILVLLMFIGGCAGSTGGGLKVSRIMILAKGSSRDIKKAINPRTVETVKLDKRTVDESIVKNIFTFAVIYIILIFASTLLISIDGFNLESSFSAVLACTSNIGPGLAAFGPASNFSALSTFSKVILSFDMLAGRLELMPMLMLFSPSTWSRK